MCVRAVHDMIHGSFDFHPWAKINSGDDDGCPTARHNEARMLICEETQSGDRL